MFLAVVVNRVRRVLVADLLECGSKTLYDKEEYVKLLQRAFDGMFPRFIEEKISREAETDAQPLLG